MPLLFLPVTPAPLGRLSLLADVLQRLFSWREVHLSVDGVRLDAVKDCSDRQPSALDFGAVPE